jgi:hypothetical protein
LHAEPVSRPPDPDDASPASAKASDGGDDRAGLTVIDQALQESCSALMALEAGLVSVMAIPGEHDEAEVGLREAIASVRLVVGGLRDLLPGRQAATLAFGFVARGRRGDR